MMELLEAWRFAQGDEARLAMYRAQPEAMRRLLLHQLLGGDHPDVLVRLILEEGISPTHLQTLFWEQEKMSVQMEPLWRLWWREQGALPESTVQLRLMASATTRTLEVITQMMDGCAGAARAHLEDMSVSLRARVLPAPEASEFDALDEQPTLWSWSQQWVVLREVDAEAREEALRGVRVLCSVRGARARELQRWVCSRLERAGGVWQPALELCWIALGVEDGARIWARQRALWEEGAQRQLAPELARGFHRRGPKTREEALLGLPWSIEAVSAYAAQQPLRPQEYTWLIAPGVAVALAGEAHMRLLEATHAAANGLVLSRYLAGVREAASWARPALMRLTQRDEPQVQAELCGVIGRLKMEEGRGWLERLVSSAQDLRVVEAAILALVVVGDVRSGGIIQTRLGSTPTLVAVGQGSWRALLDGRVQAEGQLTLSEEGVSGGGLELASGAHIGGLTMRGEEDVAQAALPVSSWELLVSSPRQVSTSLELIHLCWSTPARPAWWLMLGALWLPCLGFVLLSAGEFGMVSIELVRALWGVYIMSSPLVVIAAMCWLIWTKPGEASEALAGGAPVMGDVCMDAQLGWVAQLRGDEGEPITLPIPRRQHLGMVEGRYTMLFMRPDRGRARVEVVRALEVGAGGVLVPARGVVARPIFLAIWIVFVWSLLLFVANIQGL
jgi:hypothetical protein